MLLPIRILKPWIHFLRLCSLYRRAFTTARKPYRIWLLFTHKDTGFGAISLTERGCAAPISKGDVDLLTSRAFERVARASRVLPHQTRKPSERLWESLKAMLHETIRNDDFQRNTASQHCCDIVSNGYNITPALQPCLALKSLLRIVRCNITLKWRITYHLSARKALQYSTNIT